MLVEMILGMFFDLVVQEVLEDGFVVFSGGLVFDLVLRVSRYYCVGQEVEFGQKKKVVILNVDFLKLEVYVFFYQDLVNRKVKKLRKGSEYQVIVQYLEKLFVIVFLVEIGYLVVFFFIFYFNDIFCFDLEKLQVGQGVFLIFKIIELGVIGFFLVVEGLVVKRIMRLIWKDFEIIDEDEEVDLVLIVGIIKKYIFFIGDMVIGIVKFIKFIYVVVILEDGIIGCIYVFYILDDVLEGIFFIIKLKVGKMVIV